MAVAAPERASRSFPALLACAAEANAWLRAQAETLHLAAEAVYAVQVCFEEVFANLVLHGGASFATVRLTRSAGVTQLEISDDGAPFDPTSAAQHRVAGPLAEVQIGGLGIGLIHRFASAIGYRRDSDLNHLTLAFARDDRPTEARPDE